MKITRVEVEGLFGVFKHVIPMDRPERITIVHGPNGFGKTALLRMLHGLFSGDYQVLRETPFMRFTVTFADSSEVEVRKTETNTRVRLECSLSRPNEKTISAPLEPRERGGGSYLRELAYMLDRPDLRDRMLADRSFMRAVEDQLISRAAVWTTVRHKSAGKSSPDKDSMEKVNKVLDSTRVQFIEAQRLFHLNKAASDGKQGSTMVEAVTHYSLELAEAIQRKLAEYAAKSQQLERTFPLRVVEQCPQMQTTDAQLGEKLGAIEEKRRHLRDLGLLVKGDDTDVQLGAKVQDTMKSVLYLYALDVETKLAVFDDIARKIDLFADIIRGRFQYKDMIFDKEKGFFFRTRAGDELSPAKLSSGEQHELVLFYELLFHVTQDALILIDEPELSLHISWQRQFLRDVEKAANLVAFDVLLATHSPQIIHNRHDLLVRLEGPKER